MTHADGLVNEENVKRFFEFLKAEEKLQVPQKKIISSAVNAPFELAKCFHENLAVVFPGEDKVYAVQRYKNGDYDFFQRTSYSLYQRAVLLRQHFPSFYNVKESALRQQKLEANLRISTTTFVPHQPFLLPTGEINKYEKPYWLRVKMGIANRPKHPAAQIGQLSELQQRIFLHVFPTEKDRRIVWTFAKRGLYKRLNKALLLMGASSAGKSAILAMLCGLHFPNSHNSYDTHKFFTRQFAWGALAETTITGVNEGVILKDHLPSFKLFTTNDTFDAERKFIQNTGVRNYNNLMIATDLSECINSADQATLNRLLIPQITAEPIIGAESYTMDGKKASPFTEEELKRIYNMNTFTNKEQAEADTLALAEFLENFDDGDVNLNSSDSIGFQNKTTACENFYDGLCLWKQRFILEVLYPFLKTQRSEADFYTVDFKTITKAQKRAMKLFEIHSALREDKKTSISLRSLQELGKIDKTIFRSKQPDPYVRQFTYEISANFVDNFLASIAENPDQET